MVLLLLYPDGGPPSNPFRRKRQKAAILPGRTAPCQGGEPLTWRFRGFIMNLEYDFGGGGVAARPAGRPLRGADTSIKEESRPTLAYTYVKHGDFQLLEKPRPVLVQDRDAIVRVTLSSICTSDLHIKHGSVPRAVPGVTVGHEMVGVVKRWKCRLHREARDRVTVNVETFCGGCFSAATAGSEPHRPQRRLGPGLPHRRGPGGVCPGALRRPGADQDPRRRHRLPGPAGGRRAGHRLLGGGHLRHFAERTRC